MNRNKRMQKKGRGKQASVSSPRSEISRRRGFIRRQPSGNNIHGKDLRIFLENCRDKHRKTLAGLLWLRETASKGPGSSQPKDCEHGH